MITQKIIARTDSLKLDKIISRYGEDSMRQVVFVIVRPDPDSDELIPITIPEDAVGSFRILKPSGNFVIVPMSKSVLASGETAFDVVLPASANTAKGSGYYDIRITSETDKYYYTSQGDFLIDDNIISDEVMEDVSEVNGLIFPDDFLTVEDHVAYIDDNTISTDSTWSSNKINEEIEAHAGGDVSKTVSGNPVIFTDGADAPLVKCVTEIQGSQDLHGYDKPWVGGAGKNKLPMSVDEIKSVNTSGTWNGNTYTYRNVDITILTDSDDNIIGFDVNGTASTNLTYFLIAKNVTVSATSIFSCGLVANWNINGYVCEITDGTNTYTPTEISGVEISASTYTVRFAMRSASTLSHKQIFPMIRLSTESDSTFAPYSNICPIMAYTEGEIGVAKSYIEPSITRGAFTSEGSDMTLTNRCRTEFIPTTVGSRYKFSVKSTNNSKTAQIYVFWTSNNIKGSSTILSGGEWGNNYESVCPSGYPYMRILLRYSDDSDVTVDSFSDVNIQQDSTTHTTTYPSAIYRGSEDVVKGEVGVDSNGEMWIVKELDGTKGFTLSAGTSVNPRRFIKSVSALGWPAADDYAVADAISDKFHYEPSNVYNKFGTFRITTSLVFPDSEEVFADATEFNQWLADNHPQIAYKLATPTTSSVTPTNLPIKSLSGYTHIESSTGDMEVEYITERFQPLIDSIKQL